MDVVSKRLPRLEEVGVCSQRLNLALGGTKYWSAIGR